MDEKHLPRNHTRMQGATYRIKICLLWVGTAVMAMVFVFDFYDLFIGRYQRQAPTTFKYHGEHITWTPCGDLKGSHIECSNITVPMDQFDLENSRDKTFTIPLFRLRSEKATQNLIMNPGGPGASGFDLLYSGGEQIRTIVGDGFHLLSFDPRGVNTSTPVATCYPDAKTAAALSGVRASNPVTDSPEVYAWTQNFVKACADTMGEHAKYVNTPQTAADMNNILDALGQRDMIYWGFSYGTLLGQTYAGLYPERAKRVIIDGVVNQWQRYEGHYEEESMVDTDTVLDGFFDECIKAGATNCRLSSLATSKEELRDTVLSFMVKLRDQPISVYINNTIYGLLNHDMVWYNGIFRALYKPPSWFALADNLYELMQGNATPAFIAYSTGERMPDQSFAFIFLNDGLSGPKHWPEGREALLNKVTPWLNESLFSESSFKLYYMKQQWAIPKTHSYVPRKGVKTAHPLLILSTSYDPVCPLVSARSANEAFVGSQIVEVKGYGHCSVAAASVCLARHVRAFLYEGRIPSGYTQCEVDAPYFVQPDGNGLVSAQREFEDAEDEKIHLAQLEMARDWEFAWPILS
jgi:pimeloyl-ACP methyl ester carboxylesterase